ncbi:MAG: acyl-CoA dehydrogenase [Chloroflexi bacterium]|nr:acyl-CoA dehydrogenase [Chloroflexota bacterium]
MRLGCSAAMLGYAQRALDMAKSYARKRVTFGQPLATRQMVQEMIVNSETEVYASRLMLYHIASDYDQGKDVTTRMMMVKPYVTEMAIRVIDRAIQVHGGHGYTRELPLEMMYRDARLFTIGDGASEVLKWAAARSLLK